MMIWWHFAGQQNLSTETYRVDPGAYGALVEEWAEPLTVREEGDTGIPVVRPEPGGEAYMYAHLWGWWPILELEKGQTYRLHLSSLDWQHGFSLQPVNMNIQVHPGYEMVVTVTPTATGEFGVVCNEFCGIGHSTMIGRIHVVEPGQGGS
jgi:cytochrome c oxidase subunit 2